MSVIRRSDPDSRGVYIYEFDEGVWDCQECPMHAGQLTTILRGWPRAAWHIVRHWMRGDVTTLWPILARLGRA